MDLEAWGPHGAALRAFYDGDVDAAVVVYDDYGNRDELPMAYFFRDISAAADPADEFVQLELAALDLCRGRVLDVGAGAGCHSLYLQGEGYDVCALDAVPEVVAILRRRGVRHVRRGSVFESSDGRFDTVLMLMNGWGLAETLSGLAALLEHLRSVVEPDGQVVADSTDLTSPARSGGRQRPGLRRPDGRYVGEIEFQLEYDGTKGPPFPQLYVDPDTLAHYAAAAGWQFELVWRGEQGGYLSRLTPRPG